MGRWTPRARVIGSIGFVGALTWAADEASSNVLSRSLRVVWLGTCVLADYHRHLRGTARDSPEYKPRLVAFNGRTATRLLDVCFDNGGIYTKFGQQLATFNHALPREYTDTLARLQDRAKPISFANAMQMVEKELGRPWSAAFASIDPSPIAAASLAQVHHAVDHLGRRLAVKIQYPHLERQMKADLVVMQAALRLTEWFFPSIQVAWMFPEFESALRSELDFENEKMNNRRIAAHLSRNAMVHVPEVYDELSSKRLLVMEFIDAPKISEIDKIKSLGLDPVHVARALCEVFGEMVFCHGFVHCDPHPGNIFVRRKKVPHNDTNCVELVLLDHGLYRELDEEFRQTYCDLWRAMILRDTALMTECAARLNAGEFVTYLPLLFTYRSMQSKAPLASSMSAAEKELLSEQLRQLQISDVSDFLQQLPRDMLFVFRTNNMIRSLNKDLGGSTRVRFAVMGKYAIEGHSFHTAMNSHNSLSCHLRYWWDHLWLRFHLSVIDWGLGVLQTIKGDEIKEHRSG